jgi:subtilase family serine protease
MPRIAILAVLALGAAALEPSTATAIPSDVPGRAVAARHAPVCPGPASAGDARCHARVVTDDKGTPAVTSTPAGLHPSDLHSAYSLPWTPIGTQTIAIVDAYDDPEAEADMNVYRATFGLPPCTTANGCFKKVNQNGNPSPLPRANQGWALEISLDLQVASAICPTCNIVLVEAKTNSFANLMTAVDTAARLAKIVSNSYGAGEFSAETSSTYDGHFNVPGVVFTVSSGDAGYGVEYPAASRYVTAVGGTRLILDGSGNRVSETAWGGAGSGCSAYEAKPSWQPDTGPDTGCVRRTVADVSAVADPNTGVAVYDTHGYQGLRGWFVVGGTSASAPLIAGVYALAGNASFTLYGSYPYTNSASLFDITSGSNGSCGGSYLCTAVSGFDGPTGLGVPNGTGAF